MKKRTIIVKINSQHLYNNPLNDSHERALAIYLPPTYYTAMKEYPVVYVLPGFSRNHEFLFQKGYLDNSLAENFEEIINEGFASEMILVCLDCSTRYGGSQYINSIGSGNYADFFYNEVIPYIEQNYRTKADINARAVIGKSSGGYGALISLLHRPDLFNIAGAIAPDAGFEYCYLSFLPEAIHYYKKYGGVSSFCSIFQNIYPKDPQFMLSLSLIAMANCYSPSIYNNEKLDFLCDEDGFFIGEIWQKWKEYDPVNLYHENLKEKNIFPKFISLKVGKYDEYHMQIGSRLLSKVFSKQGISHSYKEYECGHLNSEFLFKELLTDIANQIG